MGQLSVELPAHVIADKILGRTGREISELDVILIEGRAVVRGCTCSYYTWQLAMAACRDLRLEYQGLSVDLEITVTRS